MRKILMGAVLFTGLAAGAEEPQQKVTANCELQIFERKKIPGESEGHIWDLVHTTAGSSEGIEAAGTAATSFKLQAGDYLATVVLNDKQERPENRVVSASLKKLSAYSVEAMSQTRLPAQTLIAQSTYGDELAQLECTLVSSTTIR